MLSLIVAMTDAGVIGRGGALPWRLSGDLARFKRITMGHPIVMGRKTWESIGRPLPGRTSVVVTRQAGYRIDLPDVVVSDSLAAAIDHAAKLPSSDEVFIIGGGELYREALPLADRLYVTRVLSDVAGDTTFPAVEWSAWRLVEATDHPADAKNEYATCYEVWDRKSPSPLMGRG